MKNIFRITDEKRKVFLKLSNRPTQNIKLCWGNHWDHHFIRNSKEILFYPYMRITDGISNLAQGKNVNKNVSC